MAKNFTLERIKNEVFEHPMFTVEEDMGWVIDQVAIRYANEQNRDIMESLKELVSYLDAMHGSEETECEELITAKKLINKHKQS